MYLHTFTHINIKNRAQITVYFSKRFGLKYLRKDLLQLTNAYPYKVTYKIR